MDKLDEILDFLTDYELTHMQEIFKIPENRERGEKMSRDEMAYEIVFTLAWHYKGLWDSRLPDGNNGGERREALWKKAEELGLCDK